MMLSVLLCLGLLLPCLEILSLSTQIIPSICVSTLVLFIAVLMGNRTRLFSFIGIGISLCFIISQFFLPANGFLGGWLEAVKALIFYINDVKGAVNIFSTQVAMMISVIIALLAYVLTGKNAGFLPAALLSIGVLICLWYFQKMSSIWYAAPSLIAVVLLLSQTMHSKINYFEVMPMATIVVVIAMLLLPAGKITLPPLHDAAMNLKQAISDYFFFTEPRNVFTLGNYGYYPMGNSQLGGEVRPSEYPVMMVQTNEKTYLRAVSKDEYTGRSWYDTASSRRYLYTNPRYLKNRENVFLEQMPPKVLQNTSQQLVEKNISVQIQNEASSTLFIPTYLRNIKPNGDLVPYFNDAGELFVTRNLEREDSYTITAPIIDASDYDIGAYIEAAPKGQDKQYNEIFAQYTKLPSHLEERVRKDVAQIVADSNTPFEKANAIVRHLKRHYRYTLSPETPPDNQDFVTYFLYVGKEGYCTYFASAMTVLSRMAGLPSRYVEGFVAEPSGDGIAYVTGLDAHAWTEIYFEGFGWVPFDAVPGEYGGERTEQTPPPTPEPSPEPTPEPTPEPQDDQNPPTPEPDIDISRENQTNNTNNLWWIYLLVVMVIVAGVVVWVYKHMPYQVAKRKIDVSDKTFLYCNAVYQMLLILNVQTLKGETPLAFARRVDHMNYLSEPIMPLWRLLILANYAGVTMNEKHLVIAEDTYKRIFKEQTPLNKVKFILRVSVNTKAYSVLGMGAQQEKAKRFSVNMPKFIKRNKGKKGKLK